MRVLRNRMVQVGPATLLSPAKYGPSLGEGSVGENTMQQASFHYMIPSSCFTTFVPVVTRISVTLSKQEIHVPL